MNGCKRKRRDRTPVLLGVLVLLALVTAGALVLATLTRRGSALATADAGALERGKQIYFYGKSARGSAIVARLLSEVDLDANAMPCVSCHRADGRGGREEGIRVADIRWKQLAAPSISESFGFTARPAYTPESFAEAVRGGRDTAGRELSQLMPRYRIDDGDLADLLVYLRWLSSRPAPGVDDTEIRVAVLLPLSGASARQSAALGRQLSERAARLNAAGGIAGRRIRLLVHDTETSEARALEQVAALLETDSTFCFLANSGAGASQAVLSLLDRHGVPLIGPMVFLDSDAQARETGTSFHLLPSYESMGHSTAELIQASSELEGAPLGVVTGTGRAPQSMHRGFMRGARRLSLSTSMDATLPGLNSVRALVKELHQRGLELLVLFGSSEEMQLLLAEAERLRYRPTVIASSVLANGRPPTSSKRLMLVAPPLAQGLFGTTAPGEPEPNGVAPPSSVLELAAVASFKVLVAGLKMAGRQLSRQKLVSSLERLSDFESGSMPPVSFGPSKRIGIAGALSIEYGSDGQYRDHRWIPVSP